MRRLVSALAFLTVIPFPDAWKARKPNAMFAAYPVAAALIGCALAGLGLACSLVLPPLLMAIAVAAGGLFLTGGIHLDGLADCADAFYGRREKARVLEILKDPRIGTMGGAAIGLALLTRCAALSALSPRLFLVGVPAAAVLSRTTPSLCLRLLPYVRSQGILPPGSSVSAGLTSGSVLVLALVIAFFPVPSIIALAAVGLLWLLAWRRIGGCTGDVLGAGIELAEVLFLAALAAEASRGSLPGVAALLMPRS